MSGEIEGIGKIKKEGGQASAIDAYKQYIDQLKSAQTNATQQGDQQDGKVDGAKGIDKQQQITQTTGTQQTAQANDDDFKADQDDGDLGVYGAKNQQANKSNDPSDPSNVYASAFIPPPQQLSNIGADTVTLSQNAQDRLHKA
jgi:hypothetical protein